MSVAVVPGNEAESAWRFFDLPSVCGALPTSGSPYLCSVNGVAKRLTFAQQVSLWPFIFTVRALR